MLMTLHNLLNYKVLLPSIFINKMFKKLENSYILKYVEITYFN